MSTMDTSTSTNPLGLRGIDFVEFASPDPEALHKLFTDFGFSRTMKHRERAIDLYQQNDIVFLLNREVGSFGQRFCKLHGPAIVSMGWVFDDPRTALQQAILRGGRSCREGDLELSSGGRVPALYGIGDSLLYFVAPQGDREKHWERLGFVAHPAPVKIAEKGFVAIDHLTNNVEKGTMETWAGFYKSVFGFTEVRYFDIRGAKTGLTSYALRSPDGSFCIPINEGTEKKSQINEYLEEYKGPGIQHLAFLTKDILASLSKLEGTKIQMLDIDDEYYRTVFDRVPNVTEDRAEIRRRNVLVDGDDAGYLLQIFTKNLVGPIFIEIIQRKNHLSFGEGNFGALFRSIERDQEKRGYLADEQRA
ncbi:MAG: 4-hydroxyphenylpyruvate dioxygenase [Myxococcales bacterium]|nr:4-hydroxyphenylpyruvate dioxygenase [Myxococcales bacterium]